MADDDSVVADDVEAALGLEILEDLSIPLTPEQLQVIHDDCSGAYCDRITVALLAHITDLRQQVEDLECAEEQSRTGMHTAAELLKSANRGREKAQQELAEARAERDRWKDDAMLARERETEIRQERDIAEAEVKRLRERNTQLQTDLDALRKAIRDIEGMDCGTASPSAQLDAACQIAADALEEK